MPIKVLIRVLRPEGEGDSHPSLARVLPLLSGAIYLYVLSFSSSRVGRTENQLLAFDNVRLGNGAHGLWKGLSVHHPPQAQKCSGRRG